LSALDSLEKFYDAKTSTRSPVQNLAASLRRLAAVISCLKQSVLTPF
jgi:hypothetical protein